MSNQIEHNLQVAAPLTQEAAGCGTVVGAFSSGLALAVTLAGLGTFVFEASLSVASLLVEVGLLGGVVLFLMAARRPVLSLLRVGPVPSAVYSPALKLGFVLLVANLSATVLLGPPVRELEFVSGAVRPVERVVLAVSVGLAAPIIEEALFRGLLQGVLEARLRRWFAIAAAALPFALLHGPEPALFFFFWSLPVGWITWRTASIRPAVVVHAVNNLVGLAGLFLTGPVEPESLERGPGAVTVAVVLLALAGFWALRLCRRVAESAEPSGTPPEVLGAPPTETRS